MRKKKLQCLIILLNFCKYEGRTGSHNTASVKDMGEGLQWGSSSLLPRSREVLIYLTVPVKRLFGGSGVNEGVVVMWVNTSFRLVLALKCKIYGTCMNQHTHTHTHTMIFK